MPPKMVNNLLVTETRSGAGSLGKDDRMIAPAANASCCLLPFHVAAKHFAERAKWSRNGRRQRQLSRAGACSAHPYRRLWRLCPGGCPPIHSHSIVPGGLDV